MSSPHTPKQNQLFAALPADDYARLLPDLELVPMPLGLVLYQSGGQIEYLYFPTTSIVSLLYVMENGASGESRSPAMRGWWASPCSWAGIACQARRWCKAQATAPAQGEYFEKGIRARR